VQKIRRSLGQALAQRLQSRSVAMKALQPLVRIAPVSAAGCGSATIDASSDGGRGGPGAAGGTGGHGDGAEDAGRRDASTGGVCSPGASRCSGRSGVETCGADGTWRAVVPCGNATCLQADGGAATYHEVCEPGETQCAGNALEICTASGTCGAAVACANQTYVGSGGTAACTGACSPGQTRCSQNSLQTCTAAGAWGTATPCTNRACAGQSGSASCSGICSPGQTQCSGNSLQTCISDGAWGTAKACTDKTCMGSGGTASCMGSCAPGQTSDCNDGACNSSTVTCSAGVFPSCPAPSLPTWNGMALGDACSVGTGACAASGTVVCQGTTTATCSATPGSPDGSRHASAAANGSWDRDCDGVAEQEFTVLVSGNAACVFDSVPDQLFPNFTNSSHCNSEVSATAPNVNPGVISGVREFWFMECNGSSACGSELLFQECYWSSNSCRAGGGNNGWTQGCR
jgi:hypothetical protein